MKRVKIYTDGSSRGNPGPGGYGAVLLYGEHEKRLSGGFRRTTNNRMEILAAVVALEALRERCEVTVYSDSRYVVDAMTKGWVQGWKRQGWKRRGANGRSAELKNPDLWQRLDTVAKRHEVTWKWVRGHAGNRYNEICDELATEAARGRENPEDPGFDKGAAWLDGDEAGEAS